jgi:hypothetical protein
LARADSEATIRGTRLGGGGTSDSHRITLAEIIGHPSIGAESEGAMIGNGGEDVTALIKVEVDEGSS